MADYDEGDVTTLELKGVPVNQATESADGMSTANDGSLEADEDDGLTDMKVRCEGDVCVPRFKAR